MSGSQQAARAVSIRAEVEWVIGGKHDRRDVLDAVDVPFESVDVVRTPTSWKHKRNYEGYYWAATTVSHVWFESLYERAALMRLDRDRRVVGLAAQPMWIHWSGGIGKHAPDFFVRYRDGGAAIVDVKPARQIDDDDAEVFRRTAELSEQLGWDYVVVSDISTTEHRNLRFLSGYRFDRWISAPANTRLRDCAGDRRTLRAWATLLDGVCAEPLGAIYSALWWRLLEVDEDSPLSLSALAAAV
ncbi:TnsA-like heteromeric transposase endonuclease subunit [Corynebacterium sanguinis]|uniref:TnsA-like heteromeric transposase endonuclease subunit n=1 Tax=Corynebacterium sanguinis TaxID=2594913 RepID=UPI00264CEE73|nr:TnsA-like heteromeric transposase endonuclease subunit [Corynebacterium sanguinis]MDN8622669.1 TnsA-like heteromeric transposase endonuclease subunit [Corynebacterium sanguinis]